MSVTKARQVGWIGTGKMGAPMAMHLARAGVALQVHDANAASCAGLVAAGARQMSDSDSLGRACAVIFTCIPDDSSLLALVEGRGATQGLARSMAQGSILIETSTVSPEASQRVSRGLSTAGIRYVCAPVSGSTTIAQAGKLTVLASGDEGAWAEVEPLVEHYSARRFWLGASDTARYMKLVLNTLVGATASVLGEALLLGEKGGLTRTQMMDVILESAVASPLLHYKKETVVGADATPAFRLDQMVKDFTLILAAARQAHIEMEVAALIQRQYRDAAQAGREGQDFFALVDWIADAALSDRHRAG